MKYEDFIKLPEEAQKELEYNKVHYRVYSSPLMMLIFFVVLKIELILGAVAILNLQMYDSGRYVYLLPNLLNLMSMASVFGFVGASMFILMIIDMLLSYFKERKILKRYS